MPGLEVQPEHLPLEKRTSAKEKVCKTLNTSRYKHITYSSVNATLFLFSFFILQGDVRNGRGKREQEIFMLKYYRKGRNLEYHPLAVSRFPVLHTINVQTHREHITFIILYFFLVVVTADVHRAQDDEDDKDDEDDRDYDDPKTPEGSPPKSDDDLIEVGHVSAPSDDTDDGSTVTEMSGNTQDTEGSKYTSTPCVLLSKERF